MAISSIGIGSGLDLSSLVSQLVEAERAPQQSRIDLREAEIQAKISAYGNLRGALDGIESALEGLTNPSKAISLSQEGVLAATSDSSAVAGTYSIKVNQLAQSESRATAAGAFAAGDEVVGAGTLTLQVGSNEAVTLEITGSQNLRHVRDAINASGAGVSASIVNDEDGARLLLSSTETGASNNISVSVSDDDGNDGDASGLSRLATDNLTVTREAKDAQAVIDGTINVVSSKNTLNNVIEGLSIDLLAAQAETDEAVTLTVGEDREGWQSALNGFIEAYNGLIDQTRQLTAFDSGSGESSLLTGDSTVRGLRSRLGNALVQQAEMTNGGTQSLAGLGITSDRSGYLSLDAARFNQVLGEQGSANVGMALEGIASGLSEAVKDFTEYGGLLDARTEGLRAGLKSLTREQAVLDERIVAVEARFIKQFTAMDQIVAQMQSTSSFLMGQLEQIGKIGSSK